MHGLIGLGAAKRQDRRAARQERRAGRKDQRAARRDRRMAAPTAGERRGLRLNLRQQRQADKQEFRMSENFAERARGRAASTQSIVQAAGNTASSFLNRGGGGGGMFPASQMSDEPIPPSAQGPPPRGGLLSTNGQEGFIRGVPNLLLVGGIATAAYFFNKKK
jgi:hypothetical protein